MMDYYPHAAPLVLSIEGPDTDDPNDPGGYTRFGIALNKHPELTHEQLAAFTKADALAFYRKKYWEAHNLDLLPWKWALSLFDAVVNQGNRAIFIAQSVLGAKQDGVLGAQTVYRITVASSFQFQEFMSLRVLDYMKDKGFSEYGKGWIVRAIHITQLGEHAPA